MHLERELTFALSNRKDLDEVSELVSPDRRFKEFDNGPLLEKGVADVRALLDIVGRLLGKLLQAIFQQLAIKPDFDLFINTPEPGTHLVRTMEGRVMRETHWTMTVIMSFISTYNVATRRSFS